MAREYFYFVADEGDGVYNVFGMDMFDENGYLNGHPHESGYHLNDYDVVFRSNSLRACHAWIENKK